MKSSNAEPSVSGSPWQKSEYGGDPEFQIAMHAIGNCAFQAVYEILQEKPHLVHRKGWSGHTLLHRGCLVGDYMLVQLLLQTGADPNATNEFEETPLLYACRRGLVGILHLMVQYRGNVMVVDKNGRGVAHHAAMSGSVTVLHYLTSVMHVPVSEPDNQQQTPLHIVCENGHYEALNYLLKHNRSKLSHQDGNGNTALHIAARQCFGPVCWKLIVAGGIKQLSVANRDGQTAVTLCRVNTKPGRAELLPQLEKMSKQSGDKLPYPVLAWYWSCVKPVVLYAVVVGIVNWYTTTYGALYMVLPLAFLLRMMLSQGHRMNHLCRWANPVHAGLFAAGIFHTFLIYVIKIVPGLIYPNFHPLLLIISGLLIILSLYHYIKLMVTDPGTVSTNPFDSESGKTSSILDICHSTGRTDSFCSDCELVLEGMTKHCKLCAKCYINMDHHCLFIARCIAKYNHRCFVIFLFLMSLSILTFFLNVFCYSVELHMSPKLTAMELFVHDGWLVSILLGNCGLLFWMMGYIVFQIRLIANGTTAYFRPPANARPITTRERIRNVVRFVIDGRFFLQNGIQTI